MKQKRLRFTWLVSALLFGLLSANANAFSIWAVPHGADPSSNSAGNTLIVPVGTSTIDLYFDTEGDISWFWDIQLTVSGSGSISNVTGGDINGALGHSQPDGGWHQLGGNPQVDLNSATTLMFTFDFYLDEAALLPEGGGGLAALVAIGAQNLYLSGTTGQWEPITGGDFVAFQVVPVPAAIWFLLSGIGLLGFSVRGTASAT